VTPKALATAAWGFLALFRNLPADTDTAAFGIIAGIGLVWTVLKWVLVVLRRPHAGPTGAPTDVIDEMLDAAALVLGTPTLIWLFIGGALTSAAMNSLVAWSTSYVQRELGLTLLEAGRQIGPIGLVAGVLGSWSGGRLGDALFERIGSGRVVAGALGFLVGAPACVVMRPDNCVRTSEKVTTASVRSLVTSNGTSSTSRPPTTAERSHHPGAPATVADSV